MKLSTRLAIIVASALLGLMLIGGCALRTLDNAMVNERKTGIDTLLRLAARDIDHYQTLEKSGRLSRAQAQSQALDALRALRDGEDYLFVRRMDGFVLLHADRRKEGRIDDAGKMADGRTGMQGYLDALAHDSSGFIELQVKKPGADTFVTKINGVRHIADWDWIVGYGAYTDDITQLFWHQALQFILIGAAILLLVIALSTLQARSIYRRLGGEPDRAAAAAVAIADGQLNGRIETRGGGDSLLGAMVAMQQGLRQMVGDIGRDAVVLHQTAGGIAGQMAQITTSTNQSSAATASTAAAIEQLSVSIRQIADHAQETERNAEQASLLAEEGMQLVLQVAGEMQGVAEEIGAAGTRIGTLATRTGEIDAIANVIKDIADQTNLLALNAAIEAARAGETGRGFAVVADEVRKLAERTAGATEQITQMIRTIQADTHAVVDSMHSVEPRVDSSVGKARDAADSLRHIREGAAIARSQTREVAHSTAEQSAANASLANNVEQISHMVEEAARSAEATHGSVRELEQLAARLGTLIARFRVD